ncbi:hypothetical protein GCM10011335_05440 [Aureimonas glaciei]|uniref:N-acetyltransferase domain-containing protein n=2 Tax=Aureimonas glaciei TaxID=1776957 RepID=A0A916XT22_9HYPH|nr:hypothetical protein GCM10011335_05440 [Aureimonas glaciei]
MTSPADREGLMGAKAAPKIIVVPEDPASPPSVALLAALSRALAALTGASGEASFDVGDVRGEGGLFVVARDAAGTPLGCGAYRRLEPGVAELKRMYAVPGNRGVGQALLDFLETRAREDGYAALWLETRRVNAHAVGFYRRHGYRPIDNYGRYVGRAETMCFAKSLVRAERP